MAQVKVSSLDLIPFGTLKQFIVKEREFLLINSNGQLICLDGRCTHAGAPLAEGNLEGDILTCPWHGSQFLITDGSVVRGPAETPLRAYPVFVKNGAIFIDV